MVQHVSRVVVRIQTTPLAIYDWLAFDAQGVQCAHGHGQPWPDTQQLDLAIPAAWLTAHRITLPKVSDKQRQQLITQALEDRVLGPLHEYQWLASAQQQGVSEVWVLATARIQQLQAWVSAQHLEVQRWIPEFALLPATGDCVAPAVQGLMARCAGELIWLSDESELLALPTLQGLSQLSCEQLSAPQPATVSFYRHKSKGVSLQSLWIDWRWCIYLLGVCFGLLLLSQILQWRSLANREVALRQEIRQTFASLYPGVPIVDPMLQWQSLQKQGGHVSGGDALDLLYRAVGQMSGELGAESIGVKEGKVTVILPAAAGNSLLAQLNAQGAKVTSSTLPDGRMNLELQP
ncbi:type II secretion system protein GspL [Chitinibacter sp. FCG-7]|uniref:Type II secretion system protein GspL n=1 Tax=Chitinibacter mangrovi TaxID=3153927 RepID=A0AAU7F6C5_9NEIS